MTGQTGKNEAQSSGVDALITRLREEGVSAGRDEADRVLADARSQAQQLLDRANAEAKEHLKAAHQEADAYRAAGEEALKTAMRDAVLGMKAGLMDHFSADVKRLVSLELTNPEILKQMILAVAGRVGDGAGVGEEDDLDIIMPTAIVGLEELRNDPEELEKGALTKFALGLTGEMLREGVTLSASDDVVTGIRVQVKDKNITLDLTEEAVAALLLQHLQPRFRAVLEGIIK